MFIAFDLYFQLFSSLFQVPKGDSVNYEVELGVIIGEKCRNVSESEAMNVVAGYCLALDMTNTTLLVRGMKSVLNVILKY